MAQIWRNEGSTWRLASATSYPDEAKLHSLVEEAPQMLPLAGAPSLAIVGREVQLGNGWADLIAVESSGRVSIIEIKLAKNAEARRAVIGQVLAYAAYLHGMEPETFEKQVLGKHLHERGLVNLADAVAARDPGGLFDRDQFAQGLRESLELGRFRLVIVLDSAPDELVQIAAYLEEIADKVLVDLVTVAAYDINGTTILVPQRVEPEKRRQVLTNAVTKPKGEVSAGTAGFVASIAVAATEDQPRLHRVVEWARALEREGLVTLESYQGTANRTTLLPRLQPQNAGLVTVWNDNGLYIQFWRSVFVRRAPEAMKRVERKLGSPIKQGNTTWDVDDELLALLTDAYREAATVTVAGG